MFLCEGERKKTHPLLFTKYRASWWIKREYTFISVYSYSFIFFSPSFSLRSLSLSLSSKLNDQNSLSCLFIEHYGNPHHLFSLPTFFPFLSNEEIKRRKPQQIHSFLLFEETQRRVDDGIMMIVNHAWIRKDRNEDHKWNRIEQNFVKNHSFRERERERLEHKSKALVFIYFNTKSSPFIFNYIVPVFEREREVSGRLLSQSEWVVVSNKGKKIELVSTLSLSYIALIVSVAFVELVVNCAWKPVIKTFLFIHSRPNYFLLFLFLPSVITPSLSSIIQFILPFSPNFFFLFSISFSFFTFFLFIFSFFF